MAKVSEKLLQIAELESGTRRKKFEMARLDTIARDVVELYEAVAENQHATLRCSSAGPVYVHGDRDLLAGAIASLHDASFELHNANPGLSISLTFKPPAAANQAAAT